ncbi:MAG: beta-ketoacyl synthase N-terminal-like domain-containing protein, partial [Bdellovibrionales bacterium]
IREGKVKRCLVAGAEVLCDLTVEGFRSLQLLSNAPATPFDKDRGGINLSEGAAFICLEAVSERPLAELSGFGFSTDGFHMTGPHPEGDGSFRAMNSALEKASVLPSEVTWAHAHGTGSLQNDLSEGLAMARLFGAQTPWVSSTKWTHGHALAASGALECALDVRAIQEGTILHTRGLKNPDPKIPVKHLTEDLRTPIRHILKNTLGFGGANAAIVISHPQARRQ